eukprot:CAMPEP_0170172494 /NCGR_PEP_ID=MMETSP0040_2-20121228/5722_1 /TAXON_ID=641309 /ORGANISM="Lotharella oceanica, Strain CCMP622" /LENGTH=72 /DNA_ID=CAMNT_0010413167 /DNA_START=46 /DNA_END=261 /DNA_ORIENTATION=-
MDTSEDRMAQILLEAAALIGEGERKTKPARKRVRKPAPVSTRRTRPKRATTRKSRAAEELKKKDRAIELGAW